MGTTNLFAQIEARAEHRLGEIMGAHLYAQPRPAAPHGVARSGLGADLHGAYQRSAAVLGAGGSWTSRSFTSLATPRCGCPIGAVDGECMLRVPPDQRFEVVPDRVCAVLSPPTGKKDRRITLPVYPRYQPADRWLVAGLFKDQDRLGILPFGALDLELGTLWVEPGAEVWPGCGGWGLL